MHLILLVCEVFSTEILYVGSFYSRLHDDDTINLIPAVRYQSWCCLSCRPTPSNSHCLRPRQKGSYKRWQLTKVWVIGAGNVGM
jgi:hypothetical protein